jgi:hypothetical protein
MANIKSDDFSSVTTVSILGWEALIWVFQKLEWLLWAISFLDTWECCQFSRYRDHYLLGCRQVPSPRSRSWWISLQLTIIKPGCTNPSILTQFRASDGFPFASEFTWGWHSPCSILLPSYPFHECGSLGAP